MNIVKVEITYEDGSTYTVNPKLAPDVQGTSLEDLQKTEADATVAATAEAAVVADVTAEVAADLPVVEPVIEAPVTPAA